MRSWYYQSNYARDVAYCLLCTLEEPGAISESFNVGAPLPFTYPEVVGILADQTGRKPLEVWLPVRWQYDHDNRKAKSWINFDPKGGLQTMIALSPRVELGDYVGYAWD